MLTDHMFYYWHIASTSRDFIEEIWRSQEAWTKLYFTVNLERQVFDQIDKNKAGVLTAADFVAFCQGLKKSLGWERRSRNFLASSDPEFAVMLDRIREAAKIVGKAAAPLAKEDSDFKDPGRQNINFCAWTPLIA